MKALMGFGLGILLGAFVAFPAGRRYESAASASMLAAGYVGIARHRWGAAGRALVVAALVVAAGGVVVLIAD